MNQKLASYSSLLSAKASLTQEIALSRVYLSAGVSFVLRLIECKD